MAKYTYFFIMPSKHQIKTFEKNGVKINYSPTRWWLITWIFVSWKNILYFNEETFFWEWNVRWWIPIMFPVSWPLIKTGKSEYEKCFWEMKQHWFARNNEFISKEIDNSFIMFLQSNEETKKIYDFDFKLEIICEIINSQIIISQKIKNTWNKIMPISPWFHPYFYIPNTEKNNLKISCWEFINKNYSFCNWETISMKNTWDLVKIWNNISLFYWKEFEKIWIRSEPWKDFVCVEPVYWDEWVIFENPFLLNHWEEKSFTIKILL